MREKNQENKTIRTARRKRAQDLLAVLFFLLLLPYTCSVIGGIAVEGEGDATQAMAGAAKGPYIYMEEKNGVWKVPADEFLTGALAATIPGEYRTETLKAQAVILRSICRAESGENGGLEYLTREERESLWGENFAENEERFSQAVSDTSGIVLAWEGEVVSPPFFRLSAGKTRSGAEIFGQERIPWCHSVECPHDLEAEEFLQEKRVGREEFFRKLSAEGIDLPKSGAKIVLTRDSAGYVMTVSCGEARMEGEKFRALFGLPSACFTLQEEAGEILLQTKGVGHGLGFDQYSADLLAGEGRDYIELLDCFFAGLTLEKME